MTNNHRRDNTANSTLSYGSSGSEVKKLQTILNNNGYSLDVDGKFGSKTQAAVEDYQRKNKLAVDGIVGVNTWGKLNAQKSTASSSSSTEKAKQTATKSVAVTPPRPEYKQSAALTSADKALANWEKSKPAAYSGKYDSRIEALLDEILTRGDFNYDLGSDPLYEQYKRQYTENAEKAMRDTVGQAAALSGGYANSYAVTAGSEAYQSYLEKLGERALELRDRAFDLYRQKGEDRRNDLDLLRSLDSGDYARYRDIVSDYYSSGNYLLDKVSQMSDSEYEQFKQSVKNWESDREYSYKKSADELAQQNFLAEMEFKKAEAAREQANADREYALAVQKAAQSSSGGSSGKSSGSSSGKSSGSSSGKSSGSSSDKKGSGSYPTTYKEFVDKTGYSGIYTYDEFRSREYYVKEYGTYKKYLAEMYKKYR